MISEHSAHLAPLSVDFRTWLWRYTYLLLLISMLWHRQAIFKSKGDKLCSSAECRIWTGGPRHQIASWLNARWQTDWAIEDKAKNFNSTARPYDQRAFSPLGPTVSWLSHLALAIYIFVVVNFDALAQASDIQIERRQVVFLCWMQDLNPGPRHQIAIRLNVRWQTDWAIEDQAKNLNSTARPYDQRAFSPIGPTVSWLSHLALAIYIFVVVNSDALARASDIQIERRQVVFLCWMQDLNPGPDTKSPSDWMLADKPTELSRIKLKTWTRQLVPMISEHSAHLAPLSVDFRTWLWRYTYLLLLISMLWHRQAIFKSKVDKLCSSAECRIWTGGPRHQIASWLNARWQTDWAIEDKAKNLNSTARPYDQRAFSPLGPTVSWLSHLALAIYIFVVVNFDALAQASDIQIERRQVVFLCWMQDLNPGPRHQIAIRLNVRWQTDWAIEDQAKNLNSTARPYDQRAFSPIGPTVSWLSHLALAIYIFVVVNSDALARASDIQIERRQVVFLCWMQDLNPGPDTKSPSDWMLADKPTELSRIKLKTWTRQLVPMISEHSAHLAPLSVDFRTWLWRYTYLLLLISMLWHRQAIFKSKGDKFCSSAECRIWTRGPRHQIAGRLNARWQTDWAIEDEA